MYRISLPKIFPGLDIPEGEELVVVYGTQLSKDNKKELFIDRVLYNGRAVHLTDSQESTLLEQLQNEIS